MKTSLIPMFRILGILLIGGLLLASLAVVPVRSQSTDSLLEKGIYYEETVGDYDRAVALYQQVLEETQVTRLAAAQALFRMAGCYQKQGKTDKARETFEKLIAEYPEQTQLVSEARKELPERPQIHNESTHPNQLNPNEAQLRRALERRQKTEQEKLSSSTSAATVAAAWRAVLAKPVSAVFKDGKIESVLADLGGQVGATILPEGNAAGRRISIIAREKSIQVILDILCTQNNLIWHREANNRVFVSDSDYFYHETLPSLPLTEALEAFVQPLWSGLTWWKASDGRYVIGSISKFLQARERKEALEHSPSACFRILPQTCSSSPPKPKTEPQITLAFKQAKLEMVLQAISQKVGRPFCPIGNVSDLRVDLLVRDAAIPDVMTILCRTNQLISWTTPDGTTWVSDKAFHESEIENHTSLRKGLNIYTSYEGIREWSEDAAKGIFILTPVASEVRELADSPGAVVVNDNNIPQINNQTSSIWNQDDDASSSLETREERVKQHKETIRKIIEERRVQLKQKQSQEALTAADKTKSTQTAPGDLGTDLGNESQQILEKKTQEGWTLWQQRKLTEAQEKFREVIHLDPSFDEAWSGLGWSLSNQGKTQEAREAFEKCIELNPKHPAALNGLGWIAKNSGNIEKAIQYWEKAVQSESQAAAALSGLAQVYLDQSEYEKAAEYYQQYLKIEPDNQEAQKGLQMALQHKPRISIKDLPQYIQELSTLSTGSPPFDALNKIIELGPLAVPSLILEMKDNPNWQIPKALGAIGDKRAVLPLIERMETINAGSWRPNYAVISEALQKLTGEDFGPSPALWRKWWEIKGNPSPDRKPVSETEIQSLSSPETKAKIARIKESVEVWEKLNNVQRFYAPEKDCERDEKYLAEYPDSPAAPELLNRLGCRYTHLKRFDDARKSFQRGIELSKGNSFVNTLEIDLANAEMESGDPKAAENRLRRIMALPVPDSLMDGDAVVSQCFVAPHFLWKVYQKQGRIEEAKQVILEYGRKAIQMGKEYPEAKYIPSYISQAARDLMTLLSQTPDKDFSIARSFIKEFKTAFPYLHYPNNSPDALLSQLDQFEGKTTPVPGAMEGSLGTSEVSK